MHELSAFERRLAAGLEAVAGPRRSIDAIAIARIAVSQAPVPSILSRFSAVIGQGADVRGRPLGGPAERRRALMVLIAVALITAVAFGALAVGSGLVRVPSVAPSQPDGVSPSPSLSVLTIPSPTASPALLVQRGWSSTGSMSVARAGHTATVLVSGKVLVAGGFDRECCSSSTSLASAEIYDPKSGTWSRTGSMSVARSSHTATLLASGKVLVAGGTFDNRASAELYDPETGTWSPTGKMTEPRSFHTATLLADGKVLIAGGSGPRGDANGFLATADLYDPSSNTWTAAANMTTVFGEFHRATLLSDGRVLVIGGAGIPGIQASADLYDPSTGRWIAARNMVEARSNATATLARGRKGSRGWWRRRGTARRHRSRFCRALRSGNREVEPHRQHELVSLRPHGHPPA
jgi:hypothetical protein